MATSTNDYLNYCLEILAPHGTITFRRMFGGFGLYRDGLFFAIIADDTLFFKVDDTTRTTFTDYDSEPFTYDKKGKSYNLNYYEVPVDVLENETLLEEFVEAACAVAERAKK